MVNPTDDTVPSVWQQIWEAAPRISGVVAAFGVVYAIIAFASGGIQPKSQSDIASLQDRITHLEAIQQASAANTVNDKTALYAAIESLKANINTRLDTMPRPKDFSDWEGHLHDIDGRIDALRQHASDADYNIRDLTNKYSGAATSSVNQRR